MTEKSNTNNDRKIHFKSYMTR